MSFVDKDFLDKVLKAAEEGINDTTQAAAEEAEGTSMNLPPHFAAGHPWYGSTPRIESAVSTQAAQRSGGRVIGSFGGTVRRGDYALMLERMHPYLRPAADRHFTSLAANIRKHFD